LKNSKRIADVIGKNGINILRKVFGIVLLAIAVRLFTSNWSTLLA
jgi:multiple antibiotic resistance protein